MGKLNQIYMWVFDIKLSTVQIISSLCSTFTCSVIMPPKKSTEPPLTMAENVLLMSAARILEGLKRRKAHPGWNPECFEKGIFKEAVHSINIVI